MKKKIFFGLKFSRAFNLSEALFSLARTLIS